MKKKKRERESWRFSQKKTAGYFITTFIPIILKWHPRSLQVVNSPRGATAVLHQFTLFCWRGICQIWEAAHKHSAAWSHAGDTHPSNCVIWRLPAHRRRFWHWRSVPHCKKCLSSCYLVLMLSLKNAHLRKKKQKKVPTFIQNMWQFKLFPL